MRAIYREAASDDLVRQFRYYLVTLDNPAIAIRFRYAARLTIQSIRQNPSAGPRYILRNPQLSNLRSWPVSGFETIRIYYIVGDATITIIRILHGKRDVRRLLENEGL